MKAILLFLVVAVLSATPLECMHKTCPHQQQQQTLFTCKRVIDTPHFLAHFLEDDSDLKDIEIDYPNMKNFRIMVRNVFSHIKPSDIPLEDCQICYSEDHGYAARPYITEDFNNIIREEYHIGMIIDKVSMIFKDKNITQQLIILYHLQQEICMPNMFRWLLVMGLYFFMGYCALAIMPKMPGEKDKMTLYEIRMLFYLMTPLSLIFPFILMYGCGQFKELKQHHDRPIPTSREIWHYFTNKKLVMKQQLIDHFVQEIRHSVRPNYQDDSFKEIIRSRGCDLSFSFK